MASISPAPESPATDTSAKNTTTAMPSLKSDSPAICASSSPGAFSSFSSPITAIGSVGEINAPNTRQTTKATSTPRSLKAHHVSVPTASVDSRRPTVASAPMVHLCLSRPSRSMCSEPAKSRKHSMPCMSASLKSISPRKPLSTSRRRQPGTTASAASTTNELTSATASVPVVAESFRTR